MYDTWGDFALLCEKYLVICNLPKISQNRPGLKEFLNRESAGGARRRCSVANRSLRFPAFCNAFRKTFSVWTKLFIDTGSYACLCRSPHVIN